MGRAQRSSILVGITTAIILVAACGSSSTPSVFGSGVPEGGVDAPPMEVGSFGDSPSSGTSCGAAMCSAFEYCLFIVSDAGTEMSASCMLLGNCGDCNCVMQMVSAAQCAGYKVECTPKPPYTVSCLPQGVGSVDSGAPGG